MEGIIANHSWNQTRPRTPGQALRGYANDYAAGGGKDNCVFG